MICHQISKCWNILWILMNSMGYWFVLKNDQSNYRALFLEVPNFQANPFGPWCTSTRTWYQGCSSPVATESIEPSPGHPHLPRFSAKSLRELLLLVLAVTCDSDYASKNVYFRFWSERQLKPCKDSFLVSHWSMYFLVEHGWTDMVERMVEPIPAGRKTWGSPWLLSASHRNRTKDSCCPAAWDDLAPMEPQTTSSLSDLQGGWFYPQDVGHPPSY